MILSDEQFNELRSVIKATGSLFAYEEIREDVLKVFDMAARDGLRLKEVEAERDALQKHYEAASKAAGRSLASSRPLNCYVNDIKAERDALLDGHEIVVEDEERIAALTADNARLREAAEALGAMPEGYCFCSKDRCGDKPDHEPECSGLRAALASTPEQSLAHDAAERPECQHEWIDARNAVIESGEYCPKCHATRALKTEPDND